MLDKPEVIKWSELLSEVLFRLDIASPYHEVFKKLHVTSRAFRLLSLTKSIPSFYRFEGFNRILIVIDTSWIFEIRMYQSVFDVSFEYSFHEVFYQEAFQLDNLDICRAPVIIYELFSLHQNAFDTVQLWLIFIVFQIDIGDKIILA